MKKILNCSNIHYIIQGMIISLLQLITPLYVFGQTDGTGGGDPSDLFTYICHQSFTEKSFDYFEIDDETYALLSEGQRFSLRPKQKELTKTYDITSSGQMTLTIEHGPSTNYYPDWMHKPVTTEITRQGTQYVRDRPNSRGDLEFYMPKTNEEGLQFDSLTYAVADGQNKLIEPPEVSSQMLTQGWEVLPSGVLYKPASSTGGDVFYLPNEYVIIDMPLQSSECGQGMVQIYEPIAGQTDKFGLVYDQQKTIVEIFPGIEIIHVTERRFSDWDFDICYSDSDPFIGLRASAFKPVMDYALYPNPVNDKLFVAFPPSEDATDITIIDKSGQVVFAARHAGELGLSEIDAKDLPAGLYFVRIGNATRTKMLKFVKK